MGSPIALGEDTELSSVRPISAAEMICPGSDPFEDQGESTADEARAEGGCGLEEFEVCRVECESVRANCEKVDGAEERLCGGAEAGIDEDIDEIIEGEERRSFRLDRRYMARSS